MIRRPRRSTLTAPLFPYTPLFRSMGDVPGRGLGTGTRRQPAAGDAVVAAAGHDGVLAGRGVAAVVGKGVVFHRGVAARGIAAGCVAGDQVAEGIGVGVDDVVARLGPAAGDGGLGDVGYSGSA